MSPGILPSRWCLPQRRPSLSSKLLWRQKTLDEIENEVTNSETLDSETFFSQASCKVASFPLVLNLMHKCYVIWFLDVFHFLICRSSFLVTYFHILTSKKLLGNGIGILLLTLTMRENNEKLKLSSTNKTHVCSLLVTLDVQRLYVVTEKSKFFCAILRILIRSDPKILQISLL